MKRLIQFLQLYLFYLLAFEAIRLYFIFYHLKQYPDTPLMVFIQTAFKGFRLDLSAAAYCLVPVYLVFLFEHLLRKKSYRWILRFIVLFEFALIFLIGIADPELYAQWGNKFNNQVLVYISHPKEMALSAGATNWVKVIGFIALLLPVFYLIIKKLFVLLDKTYAYSWQYGLVTVLSIGVNFVFLRGGLGVSTISQASAIYSNNQLYNATAINSFWNALYYLVNDTQAIYDSSYFVLETDKANDLFKTQFKQNSDSFSLSEKKRPNVLIVVMESFTASASKYYGNVNNCTPQMDVLSQAGLSFMRCYASGDRTEKGLVAINSGYPAQPASSIIIFPDKVNALPGLGKVLKNVGYQNTFIYGGDAEFASMKSYFLMQGFDRVIDKRDFEPASLNSKWGAHDGPLFEKVLGDLNAVKQPFYTLALSLSSHEPFDVPYQSKDLKKDEWYRYKNSIEYADACLGDFLRKCQKQAWYQNTLIIVVADHGHDIGLENIHFFGKEKYHIPLFVTGGALSPQLKSHAINTVISQTIIPSLVLQTMGLPTAQFQWQTGVADSSGFAQYHYNNGFGRINANSEFIFDNKGMFYDFNGLKTDAVKIKLDGRVYQQVLISDFLKK